MLESRLVRRLLLALGAGLWLAGCAHERPELRASAAPAGAPVTEVQVTAVKYHFQPSEIHVPEGRRVRLVFTSEDVVHAVRIPALGVKKALPPFQPVTVEFYAAKPARMRIYCGKWCGIGHVVMMGKLVIDPAK